MEMNAPLARALRDTAAARIRDAQQQEDFAARLWYAFRFLM